VWPRRPMEKGFGTRNVLPALDLPSNVVGDPGAVRQVC